MYQSYIELLEENGYRKFMCPIGPVYIQEEKRKIAFVTYHKDPSGKQISLAQYEKELNRIKEEIFPEKDAKLLCILLVDDGEIKEELFEGISSLYLWVQDEKDGKLYMTSGAQEEFFDIYESMKQKGMEVQKEREEFEEEQEDASSVRSFMTPMTMVLIGINLIVFLASNYIWKDLMLLGCDHRIAVVENHEWYRIFTSMFLHFDWEHVLGNMLVLFLIGNFVERYVGKFLYLGSYLLCGVVGNLISLAFETTDVISAGASGAIYGILGMLAVLLIKKRGKIEGVINPGLFIFVAGSLIHSYHVAGVDNLAHLGGLGMGIILEIFIMKCKTK